VNAARRPGRLPPGELGPLALARGTLDRASERRPDEALLAAYWSHPETRVLVVSDGRAAVVDDAETGTPRLVLLSSYEASMDGERYFLGFDAGGVAYFALAAAALPGRLDGDARDAGLREVGALLSDRDSGLLVHAVGLEHWHRLHGFCPNCGNATQPASGGHVRRCAACGREHYPRTDPAVIMLVLDAADRCLLGHQAVWAEHRYSILAGFVEPGESLEQAVAREIHEESGLVVTGTRYLGSQPWPFPSSLMLGFVAEVADPDELHVDGAEIHDARWFSRAELRAAVDAGEVLLPGRVSIARHIIEYWYGEELPQEGSFG
jgi:NAD+ diphosphatase